MNVGGRCPVAGTALGSALGTALGSLFGTPQGLANESIGKHEARLGDETDRQADDLAAVFFRLDLDANLLSLQPGERATKPLASREQVFELDPGLMTGPSHKIGGSHQGPIDAGGRYLEMVLALDGVMLIEHRVGNGRNLGGHAGLANEARVVGCGAHRVWVFQGSSCVRFARLRRPPKTKRADPKGP